MMPVGVLPSSALWLAADGQAERAVEVYALAVCYPHLANSRWFHAVYGPSMAKVADALPSEAVQLARARGRARDLQATVRELLDELQCSDGS
jgi:hypothetical protein